MMQVGCWRAFQRDFLLPLSSYQLFLFHPGQKMIRGDLSLQISGSSPCPSVYFFVGSTTMDIDSLGLNATSRVFS